MRVLITGITGFVGSHLAEYLLDLGVEVHGIERWRSKHDNIQDVVGHPRLHLHYCDIRDASAIHEVLAKVKPSRIFHLAAQSFVPTSWLAPAETLSTNIMGQLSLFEAIRQLEMDPVIQIAGSSEEYGIVYPKECPIKETNPLRPLSPYGVSKVGQDLLGYQYHESYGIRVIRTRAFNHTGPRRGEVFVLSNFAKQIAKIEAGLQEPILRVGNLNARRDFTDVRDVVRAYWLATEKGKPGEVYNIASGKDYTIKSLLNKLLKLSTAKIRVQEDPSRMRPSDIQRLLGDSSRFRKLTGWKPEITIEQTLRDTLDYWREQLGAEIANRDKVTADRSAKKRTAAASKRAATKKTATKKTAKRAAAKKTTAKGTTAKKTAAKKTAAKKTAAKKTAAKKSTTGKARVTKVAARTTVTKARTTKAAKTVGTRGAAKKKSAARRSSSAAKSTKAARSTKKATRSARRGTSRG